MSQPHIGRTVICGGGGCDYLVGDRVNGRHFISGACCLCSAAGPRVERHLSVVIGPVSDNISPWAAARGRARNLCSIHGGDSGNIAWRGGTWHHRSRTSHLPTTHRLPAVVLIPHGQRNDLCGVDARAAHRNAPQSCTTHTCATHKLICAQEELISPEFWLRGQVGESCLHLPTRNPRSWQRANSGSRWLMNPTYTCHVLAEVGEKEATPHPQRRERTL
jgi:hypothetical protein